MWAYWSRPLLRPSIRVRHPRLRRHRLQGLGILLLSPPLTAGASAQSVDDVSRLAGIERVSVRAEADWDETITVEAGGATEEQFRQALGMTFEEALSAAEAAPTMVPGAPVTVACHVDTFYDTGLIVYSLRTQVEAAGVDGAPVITWIRSWVGSFTTRQLHLMFTLGEQCAESFLEDWRSVN
jgi:hypothetical protein